MKTKLMLTLMFVLCLAMTAFAQDAMKKDDKMSKSDNKMSKMAAMDNTLMDKERMAWKFIQTKKFDDFAAMLADDYAGVFDDGIHNKNTEITGLKQMSFSSPVFQDMKVIWVDKDAAIVTAIVSAEATTPDGKTAPFKSRTSTVWAKRGKDWLIVYHADMPAK